jgi:redox-sensing transcriptional repressor
MKDLSKISSAVIKRLPRYRRFLRDLQKKSVERVSSGKLSELTGYTASQIRQDLNNFGGFGQQGYGYNVSMLFDEITAILGLNVQRHMVIIGAGNLGKSLAGFPWSARDRIVVDALFDSSDAVIGKKVGAFTVRSMQDLPKFLEENSPDVGIITTSRKGAQDVCDLLVAGGVKGIWNFAAGEMDTHDAAPMQSVHLSDSLHELMYYIANS